MTCKMIIQIVLVNELVIWQNIFLLWLIEMNIRISQIKQKLNSNIQMCNFVVMAF